MHLLPAQLQTLRHMLGIDNPNVREPVPYRDYFCANPGDAEMLALVSAGAVTHYASRGGYDWFTCTPDGRAAAIASHKTIRKSKSSRVYSKYLDISDCYPDLTFRQFITDPRYREVRKAA